MLRSIITQFLAVSTGSFVCLGAFCLGVSAVMLFPELPSMLTLSVLSLVIALVCWHWRCCVSLLFFIFGMMWANFQFGNHIQAQFPSAFERLDFTAVGEIEGLVKQQNGDYQFDFRIREIDSNLPQTLIGEKLRLSCYRCPFVVESAQHWHFTLRAKRPHGYASWGAFDYQKYLFRHRVIAKGYVRIKSNNELVANTQKPWLHWRHFIRKSLTQKVEASVGLSMILALTIGDKSGFTNEQRQVFQQTGASHLMAISGLHVGLVFFFVSALCRFLLWPVARIYEYIPKQTIIMFPALTSAIAYSALAGFAISTQRALAMLVVYVVCRLIARDVSLIKVLSIAMTIVLMLDPFSVLDIGFWLSCGAVLLIGLISYVAELKQGEPIQKTSLFKLQPLLWLGMMPMTISFFGQVSLVSPVVNLILVPLFCTVLVPITLITVWFDAAGLTVIATWCLMQVSIVFNYVYAVLEWISASNVSHIYSSAFAWWQWGLFFSLVFFYVNKPRIKTGKLTIAPYIAPIFSTLLVASVFFNTSPSLDDDELHVVLLDVGQGLAMVVETANTVLVYDTGPKYSSGFTTADAVLLPYLRHRGIRKIDTLVISHADNDHIGGYEAVIDAMKVKEVLTSRLDKIPDAKACRAGQKWRVDHTLVSVLSPELETPQGSNNHSCVLLLEHFGTRVLLSGDIEKQVEQFLLNRHSEKLAADILLVPHQGSKTSSTGNFLDSVKPSAAILAAGYKNHYGHPHQSVVDRYLQRNVDLYTTIESGSILLKINQQEWEINEFRKLEKRFWHY